VFYETFGSVAIEEFVCGMPVISSRLCRKRIGKGWTASPAYLFTRQILTELRRRTHGRGPILGN
jgi:hypothetical protein